MTTETQINNATRRRARVDALTSNLGKIPPQAIDMEEAVLGAILLERDAFSEIADILAAEMFYITANQLIFEECAKLMVKGEPIDLLTVVASLRGSGSLEMVGGAHYLTGLTDRVVASVNIVFHARVIAQKYVQRQLIRQSSKIIDACYDDTEDVFEIMADADFSRDELLTQISSRQEQSNSVVLGDAIGEIQRFQESGEQAVTGIPSGLRKLDTLTGGWQNSDLVIVAARPAMGKTSLAVTMAINAARSGNPVGIFSLEMSSKQLVNKEISIMSGVPFGRVHKKALNPEDWSRINAMVKEISDLPIFWDDTAGITITELCAKAKRMKRKYGITMLIVDYLQLIQAGLKTAGRNREQEVAYVSRTLKGLAKELEIPVIALSQLSRASEQRSGSGKRPMLSDLRESGSIEQDADIVMFIHRPEYYDVSETESGHSTDGMAELIIAKHRNGPCDDIEVKFNKVTTGFTDLEEEFITPGNSFSAIAPSQTFQEDPF